MKQLIILIGFLSSVMLFSTSCSDSSGDTGSISWNQKSLFLSYGEEVVIGFTGDNTTTYSIAGVPTGWATPEIDAQAMTVKIIAPAADADAATTGTIRLRALTTGSEYIHSSLFVSLEATEVDYTQQPANCYIANYGNAHYLFDARRKGNGEHIATESVDVIWETSMNLVQYIDFSEGICSFFITTESDDSLLPKKGNALLGGYDAEGNLLWSWHIWITDMDVEAEAITVNGYELMGRQLGALKNGNASHEDILASYGLYYQWGRKDPFAGPSTYDADRGLTATLFDAESNTVTLRTVAFDGETGTYNYANAHPTHFIITERKDESWCNEITNVVKGWNDSDKSVNDPCPYGWRVAPATAFDGLQIADDLTIENAAATYAEAYGWQLTNGADSRFFFAAGRRVYNNSFIQNVYDSFLVRNTATEAQPWVGYNWTSDGKVFAFWFNKANPTESSLRNDLTMGHANGMSVRCVRER